MFFAFAVYTVIPLMSAFRAKTPLDVPDVVLMGLNTVISALLAYYAFGAFGFADFSGVLTIAFTLIYIALGRFTEKTFKTGEHTTALFYLTGLTFAVLTVPIQLGAAWLSLGWLAEGVALAAYGIIKDAKTFRIAGQVICA
jgi:hypothetical protein